MKGKKAKEKQNKPTGNGPIYVVICLFLAIFIAMIANFAYYVQVDSHDDINNSYNTRQENLAAKVVRGKILASNGEVLAQTVLDNNGNEVRQYPYSELFAHVVGYSTKGRYGLENMANMTLLTSNADISERIGREIASEKNIGDNIVTTLDIDLQLAAYEALGIYKGAIVCMEPKTGRILAMVSNPGFDPNQIVQQWDELNGMSSTSPLLNRAVQGRYPPGSTFKIITLLEYYKENNDYEKYTYNCNGKFTYDDVNVSCYHGSKHGSVNLKKSFAKSCNSSFANIGTTLNPKKFRNTAEDLLFNKDLPIKISYKGSVFEYDKNSTSEEMLHTAIGQGKTLVSPIHMAMITSAIANDGVLKKSMLIDRIENHQGVQIKKYPENDYKRLMTSEEAAFLKEYMTEVVNSGTGSKLSGLSYTVAGKTGSAEYNNEKGESHAWFTGFSNVDDPELVVTVIVEGAGSGSDYAVPMAKRVFDAYYTR